MLETPGKQRLCLSNLSMNQDHKEFVKAQDSYIEANYTSVKLEGKKKNSWTLSPEILIPLIQGGEHTELHFKQAPR